MKYLKGFFAAVLSAGAATAAGQYLPQLMEKIHSGPAMIGVAGIAAGVAYVLDPNKKKQPAEPK